MSRMEALKQEEPRRVIKRDGREVAWDSSRIERAVARAFFDVRQRGAPNPDRNDPACRYGLAERDFTVVQAITQSAIEKVQNSFRRNGWPTVEEIQDLVEKSMVEQDQWEVARSFILYRQKKAELRIAHYAENGVIDFIAVSKYARYRPELKRRELFVEAVDRVEAMHLAKFGHRHLQLHLPLHGSTDEVAQKTTDFFDRKNLSGCIREAFAAVRQKRILPSMRSLQFGGAAITAANARMFNCCFSPVDRPAFFREYFYLLLAGCGCGFSVQTHHIERLPAFPNRAPELDLPVRHHTVADSIEGWSEALDALFSSYYAGFKVEFNYSQIRPRGAPLVTSGGRAPGHLPLKTALTQVERILARATGRSLRPIEAYDLCMHVARAVVAGGSRRSASICLFSPDDRDMMAAKTGNWLAENPQRSGSNNSALVDRSAGSLFDFQRLFRSQKEFGEPGFYFTDDKEYGCNPCGEIGLHPVAYGPFSEAEAGRLRELGYQGELGEATRLSGWQMCNLTTINAAKIDSADQFEHACQLAAFIGTLQAAYLDMPYLGPITRFLNERESLLGVSICGIMDNPELCLSPLILERGAALCRATNAVAAEAIGISPAARTTCVKPEGTTSLLLETASGIHPHHAKHYFRRVQVNRQDPVYQHFRQTNPQMTEASMYHPESDDVITFPAEAPPRAILRSDIGALQFLRLVKRVQQHWVHPGRAFAAFSPGLHHNVSHTCSVKPEEWEEVQRYIWRNRAFFTGVTLLPATGDKLYPQAPREEIVTAEDVAKWNRLSYHPVDYRKLREDRDQTCLRDTPACLGGFCEA